MHFLKENVWIPEKISMKFVPKGPINNIPALVQIMTWRRPGNKPLSEPMMVCLLMHICVIQPQWVNNMATDGSVRQRIKAMVLTYFFQHIFSQNSGKFRHNWCDINLSFHYIAVISSPLYQIKWSRQDSQNCMIKSDNHILSLQSMFLEACFGNLYSSHEGFF